MEATTTALANHIECLCFKYEYSKAGSAVHFDIVQKYILTVRVKRKNPNDQ